MKKEFLIYLFIASNKKAIVYTKMSITKMPCGNKIGWVRIPSGIKVSEMHSPIVRLKNI